MRDSTQSNFFVLYCDLLGFSKSTREEGSPYTFDFYGAAWSGAGFYTSIKCYLISDSLIAFAREQDSSDFVGLISWVVNNWSADGLLPQCFIGYGSFHEGRSNFGHPLKNFFGLELDGTALIDAAKLHKRKPSGARMFISESARLHLPKDHGSKVSKIVQLRKTKEGDYEPLKGHSLSLYVLRAKDGHLELFFQDDGILSLSTCYYSLLSLCTETDDKVIKHHIWTIASRTQRIGNSELVRLVTEIASKHPNFDSDSILKKVKELSSGYEPV